MIIEPWAVMNVRNMHDGQASKSTSKGDAWAHLWNKSQRDAAQSTTIIYGHDARRVVSFAGFADARGYNLQNIQKGSIQVV